MDVLRLIRKALSDEDIGTILGTDAKIIDVNISEIRDSGTLYSSSRLNLLLSLPYGGLRCAVSLCLLPLS
ncbi:MAG: hypothetical protein ACKPKO_25710, partial [Candidatus Fonsibacter sp.]